MGAETVLRRFVRALASHDEISAQAICRPEAWTAQGNNLAQLYRQLTDRGRAYHLQANEPPSIGESSRVMLRCAVVTDDGSAITQLFLLFDHIPCRLVGWTASRIVAERFVTGLVPADIGLHSLSEAADTAVVARQLADDLRLTRTGAADSLHRLERSVTVVGSNPGVIGYLRLRTGGGAQLVIDRALRLPTLGRTTVAARLVPKYSAPEPDEPLWLYARDDALGNLVWTAHRALFDLETLLT